MSIVTGVVLCCALTEEDGEDAPIEQVVAINQWLMQRGRGALVDVTDHAGGYRHPQMLVFAGGFNHLDEDEFVRVVLSQSWLEPSNVVLVMQPEEGETRVFRGDVASRDSYPIWLRLT